MQREASKTLPSSRFNHLSTKVKLNEEEESVLNIFSAMDLSSKGIFSSISQARQFRELIFLLKNASDQTLIHFLDYILSKLDEEE